MFRHRSWVLLTVAIVVAAALVSNAEENVEKDESPSASASSLDTKAEESQDVAIVGGRQGRQMGNDRIKIQMRETFPGDDDDDDDDDIDDSPRRNDNFDADDDDDDDLDDDDEGRRGDDLEDDDLDDDDEGRRKIDADLDDDDDEFRGAADDDDDDDDDISTPNEVISGSGTNNGQFFAFGNGNAVRKNPNLRRKNGQQQGSGQIRNRAPLNEIEDDDEYDDDDEDDEDLGPQRIQGRQAVGNNNNNNNGPGNKQQGKKTVCTYGNVVVTNYGGGPCPATRGGNGGNAGNVGIAGNANNGGPSPFVHLFNNMQNNRRIYRQQQIRRQRQRGLGQINSRRGQRRGPNRRRNINQNQRQRQNNRGQRNRRRRLRN